MSSRLFRWKDKQLTTMDRAKLSRNIGSYIILLAALGATAFFGVFSPQGGGGQATLGGAAAKVGGETVSEDEFRRGYQNAVQRYQAQFGDQFNPKALGLAGMVLNSLVEERIMYISAVKKGIKASDEEVIKVLSDLDFLKDDKGKFSEEIFNNFLRNNRYTEASLMEELRRGITVRKFRELMAASSYTSTRAAELDYKLNETKLDLEYLKVEPAQIVYTASDDDITKFVADQKNKDRVKDYYDKNQNEFKQPGKIKARHILVSFQGARNAAPDAAKRSKDDAKKRAEEVLGKVKVPGADFAKIAGESTDEPAGKTKGGDLGFFTKDAMVKEFSDVAFTLKSGEISGVVESPFGFHVIKVEGSQAAKDEPIEAATKGIAAKLLAQDKKPELLKARVDELLAAAKTGGPSADLLKRYGLEWKATGPFAASSRFVPGIGGGAEVRDAALTLNNEKKVYDGSMDVSGAKVIMRFKGRVEADPSKLTADKKKELAMSSSYSQSYSLMSAMEKALKKDYEDKGRITKNPRYLALDSMGQDGESGAPGSNEEGG